MIYTVKKIELLWSFYFVIKIKTCGNRNVLLEIKLFA